MCKCWSFASEDRPSFSYLLQQLEQFQETCASISEYLVPIRSSNQPIAAGKQLQVFLLFYSHLLSFSYISGL